MASTERGNSGSSLHVAVTFDTTVTTLQPSSTDSSTVYTPGASGKNLASYDDAVTNSEPLLLNAGQAITRHRCRKEDCDMPVSPVVARSLTMPNRGVLAGCDRSGKEFVGRGAGMESGSVSLP